MIGKERRQHYLGFVNATKEIMAYKPLFQAVSMGLFFLQFSQDALIYQSLRNSTICKAIDMPPRFSVFTSYLFEKSPLPLFNQEQVV